MSNIIKAKPDPGRIKSIIKTMKNKNKLIHLMNIDSQKLREHAEEIVSHMEGPEMTKLGKQSKKKVQIVEIVHNYLNPPPPG